MLPKNSLIIEIVASTGKGEDSHLFYDEYNSNCIVLGVFDGLGGRSAGFNGMTGGKIAFQEARKSTEKFLKQWKGELDEKRIAELQTNICQTLKSQADGNMKQSRLTGTLTGKRLCTTIALASIPKPVPNIDLEISFAWMGDSRVYFLSPSKGLQQLTVDDLEIEKDAFQMLREDPPMSKYLTADIPDDWQINFAKHRIEERGCIIVCTDGCFQYLPTPWDFEKLILETLIHAKAGKEWEKKLGDKYEEIKQDDVSLVLFPVGGLSLSDFKTLSQSYQDRFTKICTEYKNPDELWENYRSDYEAKLQKGDPVEKEVQDSKRKTQYEAQTSNHTPGLADEPSNDDENPDSAKILVNARKLGKEWSKSPNTEEFARQHGDKLKKACKQCQDLRNREPDNREAIFILGFLYLCLGNFKQSIDCFSQYIENSPNSFSEDEDYLDSFTLIAEAYYRDKQYENSVSEFEKFENLIKSMRHNKQLTDNQLKIYICALGETNNFPQAHQKTQMLSDRSKELGDEANLALEQIMSKQKYTDTTEQNHEVEKPLTDYRDYTEKQIGNTTDENHRKQLPKWRQMQKKIIDKFRPNANYQKRR